MNTSKKGVRLLAEICRQRGIRKVVFSPGSRSAPLVIAFSAIGEIECIVIPDERVAGYFALGMAQQLRQAVPVVCTSGTAVLNLGPAVAEAFYQNIPLLLLTADRPEGAVGKGENQAIDQAFIFQKITKGSFDINADDTSAGGLDKLSNEIQIAIEKTQNDGRGPVHVNIRLSEPLYDSTEEKDNFKYDLFQPLQPANSSKEGLERFKHQLSVAKRKLIIVGLHRPDKTFTDKLHTIAERKDIVVLIETASNLSGDNLFYNYDGCIDLIPENEAADFVPDLAITLGNQVISKRIRAFLRKYKPAFHWDISPEGILRGHDLFDVGTQPFFISETDALNCLPQPRNASDTGYSARWKRLHLKAADLTNQYVAQSAYSDFTVFAELAKSFPEGANVHYANSSPIRYANFFAHSGSVTINANRGVSGIDGCVSTAAGAACVNEKLTVCISGDIGFFYDSNALFNNNLSARLRIIVINNGGGNIFRLIDGPGKVHDFEKFFETSHQLTAKHLAAMYGIPYYFCDRFEGSKETPEQFYKEQNSKPAILEIKTDNKISERVFKDYFRFLKGYK